MDLYYSPLSAPCRSILMTAKALGLELNLKPTHLSAGDHLTPEYLKMNPQHTIPTLNDHGFILWESRPILVYLVEKYGKGSSLYPADVQPDPEKLKRLEEAFGFLNTFLESRKYAAGDSLTLADISLVVTVSTIELLKEFDINKYPKVVAWYKLCKETIPGYDINQAGVDECKTALQNLKTKAS
ncbi:unnamed protein product [Hermetia illucens]|uniref:Uncharacterized protein n=1 Tax=Hermetia illucens TaxID=343691 RepID=A0A7R8YTM4_HERIL|nr:unnamed protein product [Hermetia illucens]